MSATVRNLGGGGGKAQGYIFPASDSVSISGAAGTTATVNLTVIGDGALSVSSSDSTKATGSISGNILTITAVASGNATITITMADSSTYLGTTATISVECNLVTVGSTYKLGSGAHTAGTADLECVILDIIGTNAVCQSKGIYGGTWPDINELTSVKSTYFGNLANAVSGIYLPRGNADGSATSTTPTEVFVYNGTSFVNTYSSTAITTLASAAGNYAALGGNENRAFLGTLKESTVVWCVHPQGTFSTSLTTTKLCSVAPSFILDLTKVKLYGNLIVDINAADPPTKVSFASATPAQREAIVRAYEAGIIDITEYWTDGEEATATLPAIAASGTGWTVGESHASQEVTLVLSLDNCKELVTVEDNGQKNTKFLYHQKDSLNEAGYMNSTATNTGSWEGCARRGWCNNGYKAAMIQAFGDIFHELKNITAETPNGNTNQISNDYFALPAAKEVFGGTASAAGNDTNNSNLTEFNALKQFKYYQTASNRIKKRGIAADRWRERSPHYAVTSGFTYVTQVGTGTAYDVVANDNSGIAPFGGV